MSDKIQRVEREITRAETAPSLADVLGKPTAIVIRRSVPAWRDGEKCGRIELGRHVTHLHAIRTGITRKGERFVAFEMVIMQSETMLLGGQVAYIHILRTNIDESRLSNTLKNLKLPVDVLTGNPTFDPFLIDVECVAKLTKEGVNINSIEMWRRK